MARPSVARPTVARAADIRSISFQTQDNQNIQIIIGTSRKLRAYVRYSATARQVIIDIPNSRLNLEDERQKEQDIQHPLVEGLTAATVQSSPRLPPLTRITIDAPRIVFDLRRDGRQADRALHYGTQERPEQQGPAWRGHARAGRSGSPDMAAR